MGTQNQRRRNRVEIVMLKLFTRRFLASGALRLLVGVRGGQLAFRQELSPLRGGVASSGLTGHLHGVLEVRGTEKSLPFGVEFPGLGREGEGPLVGTTADGGSYGRLRRADAKTRTRIGDVVHGEAVEATFDHGSGRFSDLGALLIALAIVSNNLETGLTGTLLSGDKLTRDGGILGGRSSINGRPMTNTVIHPLQVFVPLEFGGRRLDELQSFRGIP